MKTETLKEEIEREVGRLENVKDMIDNVIAQVESCGLDNFEAQCILQGSIDRLSNVRI